MSLYTVVEIYKTRSPSACLLTTTGNASYSFISLLACRSRNSLSRKKCHQSTFKKNNSILEMEFPEDKETMYSFLGLVKFLNRYSPKLTQLCAPLRMQIPFYRQMH